MRSSYKKPICIHPDFLKKLTQIRLECGEEAATLFLKTIETLKGKLNSVKTESDLKDLIKELNLTNTLSFPQEYNNNDGSRANSLFLEMSLIQAEDGYYYGRILLCFPYFFKKGGLIDELKMFAEQIEEKIKDTNNVEIYGATYRG